MGTNVRKNKTNHFQKCTDEFPRLIASWENAFMINANSSLKQFNSYLRQKARGGDREVELKFKRTSQQGFDFCPQGGASSNTHTHTSCF